MDKLHILWLEDQPEEARSAIGKLLPALSGQGYTTEMEFTVTSSIDEAFDIFDNSRPDLFITDNHMPTSENLSGITDFNTMGGSRSGVHVAKLAREKDDNVPILIATAFTSFDFDKSFMSQKNIHLAQKPIRPSVFIEYLTDLLGSKLKKGGKALDAFELKPGAFGFKVDLKQIGKILRKK